MPDMTYNTFFLQPNEYGFVVYTLEQVDLRSTYRRCRIWQKKIIFSDGAHFDHGGYVNKKNCHIWGTESPYAYIEKSTHPKRVTVCCWFWSKGIIGPFFSENEQGGPLQSMAIVIGSC